jgi:hypothetical protein
MATKTAPERIWMHEQRGACVDAGDGELRPIGHDGAPVEYVRADRVAEYRKANQVLVVLIWLIPLAAALNGQLHWSFGVLASLAIAIQLPRIAETSRRIASAAGHKEGGSDADR